MAPEDKLFEEFFADRMKEKGISLKRLSDMTGIAPSHLENILHGQFHNMPSAPYFHGYLMRLGKILDFDGDEWWARLKREGAVKNSGELDKLPDNRFLKQSPPKFLWAVGVVVLIIVYLLFQAPRIFGKPSLTVIFPSSATYTTASNTLTFAGTVSNADSLYLSNGNSSSGEQIAIGPDGSWQKTVLLQNGLNPFEISAKKFLGGETDIVEQILYQGPAGTASPGSSTASSTSSSTLYPNVHFENTLPATGTYFN